MEEVTISEKQTKRLEFIENGQFKIYRLRRYQKYKVEEALKLKNPLTWQQFLAEFAEIEEELNLENLPELERLYNSKVARRCRLGRRLDKMFFYAIKNSINISFVTFTFNEDAKERSNLVSKRRALTKALRMSGVLDYVANIDFGEENGREHFHAVILGQADFTYWQKTYGFVLDKQVNLINANLKDMKTNEDSLKKYILKFENHATKESVKCDRLISKRGVDDLYSDYIDFDSEYLKWRNKSDKPFKDFIGGFDFLFDLKD